MLRVLSLGAGVQSTTLALMAAVGEIPEPDFAIFADTGWEPAAVYEHLDWLTSHNVLPYPVHRVSGGNIRDDLLRVAPGRGNRWASIPAFVRNRDGKAGMIRRQCTQEYKIEPIRREVRARLGINPRGRPPKWAKVEMLIGISTDEAQRMKPARDKYVTNRWPLVEQGMSRGDCVRWLTDREFPIPPKSACVCCPFRSDDEWSLLTPQERADAAEADRAIRHGRLDGEVYLHRSLVPLAQVHFEPGQSEPDHFGNECEGMCGV